MGERAGWGLAIIVGLGGLVRCLQGGLRWDEVALAYAAYTAPAVEAVADAAPRALLTAWVGLHPPLHAAWMALVEQVWPAPVVWIGFSVLASTAAVWLVGQRAGLVAAALLASAPLQVAYAGEVNNYPLAVLSIAALLAAQDARRGLFLAAVALASWAHVLTAAAAGGAVVWRLWSHPGDRLPVAAGSAVVVAPVVAGALRLASGEGTFVQAPFDLGAWLSLATAGVGWVGLVLGGVALAGLRGPTLAVGLPLVVAYGVALLAGAAAPHQLPYLLLPAPVLAVALGQLTRRRSRGVVVGVLVVCGLRLVMVGGELGGRTLAVAEDLSRVRGVDRALVQSDPGDVIWLVAPALQADDDKTDSSPVLWRLGVLSPMPMERWPSFDYLDWRFGQPRQWRGRVVHTSTELAEQALDHVCTRAWEEGRSVWVVLYDHAPAAGLSDRVERAVRPWRPVAEVVPRSQGLGDDLVYLLRPEDP